VSLLRSAADRVADAVHELHGSRSLAAAGALVLVLTLTEAVLPEALLPGFTGLAVALLAVGLLTLPREAAHAQQRMADAVARPDAERVVARLLVLPLLLLALLLPRLFLGAYGIPHLTPASGLLLPTLVRRLALVFLAAVLLVPVAGFRQARHRLGPGPVARPRDLGAHDLEDDRRELLLGTTAIVGGVWLLLLQDFWTPFSLLGWPPGLGSLASARGVTALAFALVVPAVLFAGMALDAELLRSVRALAPSRRRTRLLLLAGAHLALLLIGLALHAYDLLWIAKYQAASGL
jgi:hypothetical protein